MKLSAQQLKGIIKEELGRVQSGKGRLSESTGIMQHPAVARAVKDLTEALIEALGSQPGPSGDNFDDADVDGIHVELENAINSAVDALIPQFWS